MRGSTAGVLGLVAVVMAIIGGGPAQAAAPVFFNYRGLNCAVTTAGLLGCDLPSGMVVMERPGFLPAGSAEGVRLPVPGRQITQDVVGGPLHAVSRPGTPFTLPGGNPPPVLDSNGCPGQACTPNPTIRGTRVVCGDGHYMAAGCINLVGRHGFSLSRPGEVQLY